MIHFFNEKIDVAIVDDPIVFSCSYFLDIAKKAILKRGKFTVALSGGSTPQALYSLLKDHRNEINWSKVFVFFSDERACSPQSNESNYFMAMMSGFFKLPIPKNQIFRMKGESNIEENAKAYELLIKKHVENESFDLILLGMGDDGHTASLFPKTKALDEKKMLVVENKVPEKNTTRMTFTYPLINKARHVLVLVLGKEKSLMVKNVLTDTNKIYPTSSVALKNHKVLWALDKGSATDIFPLL